MSFIGWFKILQINCILQEKVKNISQKYGVKLKGNLISGWSTIWAKAD